MASYNGEKYISQQIDSIIRQSNKDWELFIRDDGSIDKTVDIIKDYSSKDGRIHLYEDPIKHVGAKQSFMKLLECVDSELYMFCDQDDIWLPEKIERSLHLYNMITDKESKPIIVHTDATVVDENLNVISESYWKSAHIVPERYNRSYSLLSILSCVQGTTMLFNKNVKSLCFPLSDDIKLMHDSWVATRTIKAGGRIEALHESTILYRQHSSNVYGVASGKDLNFTSKLKKWRDVLDINKKKYISLKHDNYGGIVKYLYNKAKISYYRYFLDRNK